MKAAKSLVSRFLKGEEGVTLIVVTHARELAGRMGRVLELRDGRLIDEIRKPNNEIRKKSE